MVGIAEEPPHHLAPSVGKQRQDFVIQAGFIVIFSIQTTSGSDDQIYLNKVATRRINKAEVMHQIDSRGYALDLRQRNSTQAKQHPR
jgi:hypothetical protein